jgi:hypothetical protein
VKPGRVRQSRSILSLWILVTLLPLSVWCQKVIEREGDIFLVEGGKAQQLTHGGSSHDPFLASGCETVFFVRDFRQSADALKLGHSEIWSQGLRPSDTPVLVYRGPFRFRGIAFAEFWHPEVTSDCRHVYFMFAFASTTHGIARLDRDSTIAAFVASGDDYRLAPGGRFRGDLFVLQRRSAKEVGYDQVWVALTPEGREIEVLGKLAGGPP